MFATLKRETTEGHLMEASDITKEDTFKQHLEHYSETPWLYSAKREAWDKFNELPMPVRVNEKWRFAKLKDLSIEGYGFTEGPSEDEQFNIVKQSELVENYAGRLVFEDNHLIDHDFIDEELEEKGVIWEPLQEAFEKHPELLEKYFAKEITKLGSEKFQYLNIAYAHTGSCLYVPSGVEIDLPLIAYHWGHTEGAALFPTTIIVAEDGTKVNLIDVYQSHTCEKRALAVASGITYVGREAQVHRKVVQNWNSETTSFQIDTTITEQNSRPKVIAVNLGSKRARYENLVKVTGKGAEAKLYSVSVADGEQEFDQRTEQIHEAENSVSDLLYKNALLDKARTIFSGTIIVGKNAQKTDAYQTNRNLLLSDQAEACSLPGLEIEANDVKCSHGATSGDLDKTSAFYMRSRGIPQKEVEKLLTFGHLNEVLQHVENQELSEKLSDLIEEKFNKNKK